MSYSFFAMMARMRYIERWALMRNANPENVSEHSMEVAMLAHGLAVIGVEKCGKKYSPEKAALIGLYHDAAEIITGDMPTPVKYFNQNIREEYKKVEIAASKSLIEMLPDYMRKYYKSIILPAEDEKELWMVVKAADKLSALIKCLEERKAGNREFTTAYKALKKTIGKMDLEEVEIFVEEFLPAYQKTLDELSE